jgi:hypothetical protein
VIVGFLLNWLRDYVMGARQTKTARKRLAVALLSESVTLRDRYNEVFGDYIRNLPVGQPLTKFGTIQTQDFFAVYDGNAGNLGLFPSSALDIIVRAYTLAKAHAGTMNNAKEMFDRYQDQIGVLLGFGHGADRAQQILRDFQVDAANMLRDESAKMFSAAGAAIKILEAYAN